MSIIQHRTKGVLPIQTLKVLEKTGFIKSKPGFPILDDQFQPNSIDLRLGLKAYRVRASFLPENEKVQDKIDRLEQYSFSIEDGAVLEPNVVYIIPLLEEIDLRSQPLSVQQALFEAEDPSEQSILFEHGLSAKANPKSTTGRLDIFTRLITDYSHRFEEIEKGYHGPLYLEVVPKSFPIRIKTGQRLNQLRVHHGHASVSDEELLRKHSTDPLLLDTKGQPLSVQEIKVKNGLFLSIDLHGDTGKLVGYKAKKNRSIIDLEQIGHYDVEEFWEPIYAHKEDYIILEPEAFYIFASKERCRIPAEYAAEMVAYDTGTGEVRSHYAGFFDSGFGGKISDGGAKAVLEIRSHDVPFLIEDGQTICSMIFESNAEKPLITYGDDIKSNYQGQKLKLSKHFKAD